MNNRETLGSRLGFILLSAGCAIGIGNVWKFPYMVGQSGGGAFVLIYLFFLLVMGVPVMTIEFAMGRASQRSPVKMYKRLEKPGSKWHLHGYAALIGNYLLMMFYTTVTAWLLMFFVDTASGKLAGLDATGINQAFDNMIADPISQTIYMVIVVVVGFAVCSFSLQKGLERVTKYMMLALLAIMVILAVNSVFLPNASEGVKFYLTPSFENMKTVGIGTVIANAMNQAFFTLSLGIGSMAIFGSYLKKDRSLLGEAINVATLDTFVALIAGFIVIPALFAYTPNAQEMLLSTDPDVRDQVSGPGLIFTTLPNIFNNMPGGRIWGSLFFVFLSFAAFSTVFAVFENIVACCMDQFGWSRKKTCLINTPLMILLSLPCLLGYNVLSHIGISGKNIMNLEDFVVSNVLLPLGSLTMVLFCTIRYGWGWEKFKAEANEGKGLKVANWMRPYVTFVLPIIILVIFVVGIINAF